MSRTFIFSSLCALLTASCTHEYKNLTINTIPQGATIHINGEEQPSKTPFTMEVYQRGNVAIVAKKEGYLTATKNIEPETDKFIALCWTDDDIRARYIEEDEVSIPMEKIEPAKLYKPTELPSYNAPFQTSTSAPTRTAGEQTAPALRPLPQF